MGTAVGRLGMLESATFAGFFYGMQRKQQTSSRESVWVRLGDTGARFRAAVGTPNSSGNGPMGLYQWYTTERRRRVPTADTRSSNTQPHMRTWPVGRAGSESLLQLLLLLLLLDGGEARALLEGRREGPRHGAAGCSQHPPLSPSFSLFTKSVYCGRLLRKRPFAI
jgi:hypothetical protein